MRTTRGHHRPPRALLCAALVLCLLPACTRDAEAPPQAASSSSGSVTPDPVPTLDTVPTRGPLRLAELPRGRPPQVEYLDGDEVVLRSGRRVTLPLPGPPAEPGVSFRVGSLFFWTFAPLHDGWLASTFVTGGPYVQRHDSYGRIRGREAFTLGWILDWSPRDGRVLTHHQVIDPGGSRERLRGWPVGFVGSQVLVTRRNRSYVGLPGDWHRVPGRLDATATAAEGDRMIARGRHGAGVFEVPSGDELLRLPRARGEQGGRPGIELHDLSPRGRYVVGTRRGPRPATLFIADVADGSIVASARGVGAGFEAKVFWESERSLLIVKNRRHLIRVRVGGRVERAAEPARSPYGYVLPGGGLE